ncbi:MAG: zinc ribbon domain-containing protein [candidate division WS1 bacterium]|nr:zinc ribbon domain-containing protein [candidate division WS1 bacterium]
MPIYEYECGSCNGRFDVLVSRSKADKAPKCELCGAKNTKRVMSGFFGRAGSGDGESTSVGSACAGCTASSCSGCTR